jgi:predicted kinase
MDERTQRLIVICGAPATGKTTLSEELSRRLNIVCLNKDAIKERLYELLRMTTLDDSRAVGRMSIMLLKHLAEIQIERGVDLIIESPFTFPGDNEMLAEWQDRFGLKLICIVCVVEQSVREHRFVTRQRHVCHHDSDRRLTRAPINTSSLKMLPGKVIRIDTDRPNHKVVEDVLIAI